MEHTSLQALHEHNIYLPVSFNNNKGITNSNIYFQKLLSLLILCGHKRKN